jgi:hypothetical protein
MLYYNSISSQADCGSVDAGLDTLAGRSTRATIGIGVGACLGFERLSNGLLFLLGLFLVAHALLNVNGTSDCEVSELLGLGS